MWPSISVVEADLLYRELSFLIFDFWSMGLPGLLHVI